MDNQWEYDYSNLYSGSNGNAGANGSNGSNGSNGNAGAQRPGDTSTYSTDASCGYTPQGSASAGGPADGQPPRPKKPVNGKKILTGALCLVLAGAVGFGGGYLGAIAAGGGNRVVYQTVQRDASSGDTTGSAASTLSLTDVSSIVSPSVVAITTEVMTSSNTWFGGQYVESGAGSGVIMSEDGYIITNNHVVSGASNVTVTLQDGSTHAATVVGADSQSDIAVVKIDATGLTPAVMGDSDKLAVGETVLAVGNPLGELSGTVTNGIVSALNREVTVNNQKMTLIQTNASISPGNSGGGLFNAEGDLIGIVNAKSVSDNAEGLGFAIPVNTAIQVATDLIQNGYVSGRPVMGVTVVTISDAQTAAQYGVSSYGVYVAEVTENGPAAQAGVQKGDRIVSVDDTLIESNNDLTDLISSHAVGDTLNVQLSRDRQLMNVQVTLGERTEG